MESENITNYLKHYGFFLPAAEIYGGLAHIWDWGPLGVELKRNLKKWWWKKFITTSPYNVGSDSAIITHPQILEASGHLKNFNDWLVECRGCQKRYRVEELLSPVEQVDFSTASNKSYFPVQKKCPICKRAVELYPRQFNLLLSTNLEITENKENRVYLRPETCQGIFVNFSAIQLSTRKKLPFGIGQIGKSFRNEITLRHGIFRTREFEQMELEFFCLASENQKWWEYWTTQAWDFLQKIIVNPVQQTKKIAVEKTELPHYSQQTLDFYCQYHFGWGEVCSSSQRGDYDLTQHSKLSGKKLSSEETNPVVIEVSFGVERLLLAMLESAYRQEEINEKGKITTRQFLQLPPLFTPYFVAIIPQPASKENQGPQIRLRAYQLYCQLLKEVDFALTYEETDSIGKSYRRQDAIGTYYCLTMDTLTVNEYLSGGKPNPDYNTVTLRQRDNREQEKTRIKIEDIKINLNERYRNETSKFLSENRL
ncbi:MAG: glycine--tRNA ligase [Candidatus Moeniiplasma glomeromycotorum]|nr:glycine--tRNA ligase [Candidatus Moeniiplasma glomeromycotorum]MCE8167735.1 glycine--tRNA ligase [Candidatus Moeniiplasma glomeromycotorum]MCE8169135.1 glycine--tRNA ligase [Candidatus Moeniiplasma glomeromycotorum]